MKPLNDKFQAYKRVFPLTVFLLSLYLVAGMAKDICAGGLTRISIGSNVQVNNEKVFLGHIAGIDGPDPLLNEALKRIVISRAPQPGASRVLRGNTFRTRLKQNGINLSQLVLQIPAEVVVTRSFVEVGPEKIKKLVSDYILQNILKDNVEGHIKNIQVTDSLRLPNGGITFKVVPPSNRKLVGKMPFAVHFNVNGKFYKRVWATATVEVMRNVVVTRKPLGRHKQITEDDIVLLKMDLAKLPSDVITHPDAILGKRTKRAIGAKTVLRANSVELPPLVKRGDVVVILAESNGLKITTLGQVKRKGRLGESIPVVNYNSKKILYARVLDSSTVKVEF